MYYVFGLLFSVIYLYDNLNELFYKTRIWAKISVYKTKTCRTLKNDEWLEYCKLAIPKTHTYTETKYR